MEERNKAAVRVIDSHTGGEPTRVVVEGGPALGSGPLPDRLDRFRRDHDRFRRAVVQEPRGSEAMVGALLVPPILASSVTGVIFFDNAGYLGMCGHGTMGVAATMAHLGRISFGHHRIETPVGEVEVELHPDGDVTLTNVPSYRWKTEVKLRIPRRGGLVGEVAYGGNWFFLVDPSPIELKLDNAESLLGLTSSIRQALRRNGITGAKGAEIDHIGLFGPSPRAGIDSRNFVLCPGRSYDRSPCGTGTSAKLASLYAGGQLKENEPWRQESIVGSVFEGRVRLRAGSVVPTIRGRAFVNGVGELLFDPQDPYCYGIS